MNTSRVALVLTTAALFATGCANTSNPNSAKTKSMSVEQISQQWKQGNDLVSKGEEVKRKAQAKIDAANQELKEGDSLVARGKTLMGESEQAFRDTSRRNTSSN